MVLAVPRRIQSQTDRDLAGAAAAAERRRLEADQLEELADPSLDDAVPFEETDEASDRTPVAHMLTAIQDEVQKRLAQQGSAAGPHRGVTITHDDRVDFAIEETVRAVTRSNRNAELRAQKLGKHKAIEQHAVDISLMKTQLSIVRWVGMTVAAFALASTIVVARMLFGWGRDDAELRNLAGAAREQSIENKGDIKELRSLIEELRRDLTGVKATIGSRRDRNSAPSAPSTNDPGGSP